MSIRWRKRPANIPDQERDTFERYGEHVIGSVLAGGFQPTAVELQNLSPQVKLHARDWLTECRDSHEIRERRLEILEWAIVLLIVVEIIVALVPCVVSHGGSRTSVPASEWISVLGR
jgi:hypothetical protein